ncbi:ankyrin repeat domain-containing protein [bacterium]|nr:MAG: ankyrin repeat domain-containing protein [bacterium]
MNIITKLLLSVTLILSATITESKCTAELNDKKTANAELDKAFISAVKKHNLEEMQKLMKAGADVNTPIPYVHTSGDCDWNVEATPLMFAIKDCHLEMAKMLLQVKNKLSTSINSALCAAVEEGCLDIVEELIKEGLMLTISLATLGEIRH